MKLNEQATANDTDNHSPGTVLPVADDPERFYVLGSREWWYEVRLEDESSPASCECEDHTFRRRDCRHIVQARAFRDLVGTGVQEEVDAWAAMSEAERKAIWA